MLLWNNKKLLWAVICLFVWGYFSVSVYAQQKVSDSLTAGQSERVITTPEVTDIDAPSCLRPGSLLTVYGYNLNAGAEPEVVLLDQSGYYPLFAEQIAAEKITAKLSPDVILSENGNYNIALKNPENQQWIKLTFPILKPCTDIVSDHDKKQQEYRENPTPVIRPVYNGSLINSTLQPPPVITPILKQTHKAEDIEPDEILAASDDMASAKALSKRLQTAGYHIRRRIRLDNLGLVLSVFKVPEGKTVSQHLKELHQAMPDLWTDYNRHYFLQSQRGNNLSNSIYSLPWSTTQNCGKELSIGMLDTTVDANISGTGGRLIQQSFLSHGVSVADNTHGTAVAALLAGKSNKVFSGLLPQVRLYSAAVFQTYADRTFSKSETILKGLNWLTGKHVRVINISMGGRRNLLVELALRQLMAQGVIIVAAAGNNGPDSSPVYPAAQPGVIAVTAVDIFGNRYYQANTGDYIDFAAYGVDIPLPATDNRMVFRSGTSFAAPFASARLLLLLSEGLTPEMAYQQLSEQVRKPSQIRRDSESGWGIIKFTGCNQL